MPFTVPSPLAPLYAYFPLLTVPNDDSTTPAPSKPTLWVLGPPPTGHKESIDPVCRQAQAFARFSQVDAQPRYLPHGQGAPGGNLPALHLPQGDLIESEGVHGWISTGNFDGKVDEKQQDKEKRDNDDVTPQDPILQAYTSLVETTLLPAVVAALYLLPTAPQVTPSPNLPFLSQLASKWLGISKRQDRISQVKRLRGGKVGSKVVLDLEEVEREAVEALQALEDKMRESRGDGEWFLGARYVFRLPNETINSLTLFFRSEQFSFATRRSPLFPPLDHLRPTFERRQWSPADNPRTVSGFE